VDRRAGLTTTFGERRCGPVVRLAAYGHGGRRPAAVPCCLVDLPPARVLPLLLLCWVVGVAFFC